MMRIDDDTSGALHAMWSNHQHDEDCPGRGGGGQYPSAVVHDGTLYALYSMGKEDI